jgi:hypothetical protein
MYSYHVVYSSGNEKGPTIGSITIDTPEKMDHPTTIKEISEYISKDHNDGNSVVILNWIKLNNSIVARLKNKLDNWRKV